MWTSTPDAAVTRSSESDWKFIVVLFRLNLSWKALRRAKLGSSGICKKRLYWCFGWQPTACSLLQRLRGDAADRVTLAALVIVWCLQLPWAFKQLKCCFFVLFLNRLKLLKFLSFLVESCGLGRTKISHNAFSLRQEKLWQVCTFK